MSLPLQTGLTVLNSRQPSEVQACNTETFKQVTFPTPFPDGTKVIVVPFVQSFNGPDSPGLRIADVSTTGFKIRMNELVAHGGQQPLSNGVHCAETIGWIAFAV